MSEIDKNTFGGSPAAETLVKMISQMDKKDASKILFRISRRYHQYTKGMKAIRENFIEDEWRNCFARLWYEDNKKKLENAHIPIHLKTYLANIEQTLYKRTIRGDFD